MLMPRKIIPYYKLVDVEEAVGDLTITLIAIIGTAKYINPVEVCWDDT
jgi:hypothetical protein